MMWNHAMQWHWLESLGLALFWLMIILLALVPTNYLRDEWASLAEADLDEADARPEGAA
ncbi:MAG: SHOCT domain-containing protein [Bacillota bacterium]